MPCLNVAPAHRRGKLLPGTPSERTINTLKRSPGLAPGEGTNIANFEIFMDQLKRGSGLAPGEAWQYIHPLQDAQALKRSPGPTSRDAPVARRMRLIVKELGYASGLRLSARRRSVRGVPADGE
jgi:hypothetical protein